MTMSGQYIQIAAAEFSAHDDGMSEVRRGEEVLWCRQVSSDFSVQSEVCPAFSQFGNPCGVVINAGELYEG